MIAYRTGQIEEAKSEFRRATELDKAQHLAWANLATIYFNEHDYEAAEQAALHGLEKSPNVPKLHFLAGTAQLAGKRSTNLSATISYRSSTILVRRRLSS